MQHVADSGVADERTVELPTGSYAVLTVKRGDDIVQAIASRYEQHQERERILGALAVAGGAGLVLATLAAGLLARRAVRPMASALELQRRFVADAGHELRTPLTLLSTRAQLLARRVRSVDGAPTQEAAQLIGRDAEGIVTDTSSLTAVLEELLMAADVRTPVPQELVDVSALATAAVAAALATAEGADLTLGLETGEGSMMTIGAPTALSRSVTALIDNALGHARTHVTVTVIRERRHVVVTVIDDGPGIATDLLPRVFERFRGERAVGPDDGAARHFGLGLSLVSEIARRHGGTVTATNRTSPDTGAVLSLAVPAA